ncbi:MAG: hypothetical protein ABWX58_06345 [Psychrobacillus psychrotolerans]
MQLQTVKDLDKALAYKGLISYGELLKEIHKALNLEDGNLIHIDDDTDEVANGVIDVMAYWHEKLHRSKIIFYFRRERYGSFCRIFSAY